MKSRIILVCLFPLSMATCASFDYQWYGVGPDEKGSLSGTLKGKKPSDDLDMTEQCYPREGEKGRCVIVLRSEWERIVSDMLRYKSIAEQCDER